MTYLRLPGRRHGANSDAYRSHIYRCHRRSRRRRDLRRRARIDGARATGRRPAQSFSRHSGDGARRPGGLHHPGKSVRSSVGEDMGRIVDIIVSRDGRVHAAVIDFGGFLGIGTRKIAVDWYTRRLLDFLSLKQEPACR